MKTALISGTAIVALACSMVGQESKVIRWAADTPGAREMFSDGMLFRSIGTPSAGVMVGVLDQQSFIRIQMSVTNIAGRPKDLLPENVELFVVSPKPKQVRQKNPLRMAAGAENNARTASMLDQLGAALQAQRTTTASTGTANGTVTDNRGGSANVNVIGSGTSTTTAPDWEARRQAAERTQERLATAGSVTDFILANAIRAHTLQAGETKIGLVWFDRAKEALKPGALVVVRVTFGEEIFDFPFHRR